MNAMMTEWMGKWVNEWEKQMNEANETAEAIELTEQMKRIEGMKQMKRRKGMKRTKGMKWLKQIKAMKHMKAMKRRNDRSLLRKPQKNHSEAKNQRFKNENVQFSEIKMNDTETKAVLLQKLTVRFRNQRRRNSETQTSDSETQTTHRDTKTTPSDMLHLEHDKRSAPPLPLNDTLHFEHQKRPIPSPNLNTMLLPEVSASSAFLHLQFFAPTLRWKTSFRLQIKKV